MRTRTLFLKLIDKVVGTFLVHLLTKKKNSQVCNLLNGSKRKILFIRPGGIGDAVLLVPIIMLLKREYPNVNIDVLAEKRNSSIFSFCAEVDFVYHYHKMSDILRVVSKPYDVVIDSEQWHRLSSIVTRLVGAPISIGFATNERRKHFTHPIYYSHTDHEIDSFYHLTSPIFKGALDNPLLPFLSIPSEVSARTNPYLIPLSKKKLVAIFPGGSIQQKRWERDKFNKITRLLALRGYGIVLIGGNEDCADAVEISKDKSNVVNCCGKLSLIETASVIKEASLLITTDSGIMHIAYGLGISVLALFGPSNIEKWAPRSAHSFIITKHLECSPCSKFGYTPRCKIDVACMKQITVEEVIDSAIKILET